MALETISNLIIKYKRLEYAKKQPRSGAQRQTAPRIDQKIVKTVQDQFLSAPKPSNLLGKELGIQVSTFTIRNQLKESGFNS